MKIFFWNYEALFFKTVTIFLFFTIITSQAIWAFEKIRRPSKIFFLQEKSEIKLKLPSGIKDIYTDSKNRFYADFGNTVYRITDEVDKEFSFFSPAEGFSAVSHQTSVAPSGVIYSMIRGRKTVYNKKGKVSKRYYRVDFQKCLENGECINRKIASWSRSEGQKNYTKYSVKFIIGEKGTPLYSVSEIRCRHKKGCRTINTEFFCDESSCNQQTMNEILQSERKVIPVCRYGESGVEIICANKKRKFYRIVLYDVTRFYDSRGIPHIFFQNKNDKSFSHATVTNGQIKEEKIDMPESGFSNAAAALPEGEIVAFSYFYRNPFYKGVLATFINRNGDKEQHVVHRERDANPGWGLKAAATSRGRVMLSYKKDGRKSERVYRIFRNKEAVAEAALDEPEGWERDYRNFFFMGGGGIMYSFWHITSARPSSEDVPGDRIIKPDYNLADSLINEFSVEGRYGSFSLALTYLKSFISDKIEATAGKKAATSFDFLAGSIGFDKLFLGLDLRVSGKYGKIKGGYRDKAGLDSPAIFDSDYRFLSLSLLDAYRLRYSVFYQNYDFHIPVYAYKVEDGKKSFSFSDSFGAGVRFHDVGFTFGYSRLDYAVKYENKVFDWFVAGDIGIGLSIASLEKSRKVEDENISRVFTFMFPFNLEGGIIWYKRWHRIYGTGIYSKIGYRVNGNFTGFNSKPDDLEDPVSGGFIHTSFQRTEIRHGPFLSLGFVF